MGLGNGVHSSLRGCHRTSENRPSFEYFEVNFRACQQRYDSPALWVDTRCVWQWTDVWQPPHSARVPRHPGFRNEDLPLSRTNSVSSVRQSGQMDRCL